jgi:hypothetical protein
LRRDHGWKIYDREDDDEIFHIFAFREFRVGAARHKKGAELFYGKMIEKIVTIHRPDAFVRGSKTFGTTSLLKS